MKLTKKLICCLSMALVIASPTSAYNNEVANTKNYYKIGGGRALSGPPSYVNTVSIGGANSLQVGYSCGKFDIEENFSQLFESYKNQLDYAVNALVASATEGLVSNLIMYSLRRADPNLADMFEDAMLRYEELIQISIKNCQQAEEEIRKGENPFYDYISFGRARKWREEAEKSESGDSSATATGTDTLVNAQPGCIPWIDGVDRLCDGNGSIDVVREIVEEGYSRLNEPSGDGELGLSDSRLQFLWQSPGDASEWVVSAFGDITLTDVFTESPASRAGRGVMPMVFAEAGVIKYRLNEIISTDQTRLTITEADQELLSVPGLSVSTRMMHGILAIEDPVAQNDMIDRVATEFATLRAMERINVARRLLNAGLSEPNVIASGTAASYIRDKVLPDLALEYSSIQSELELRKSVSSTTAYQLVDNFARELNENRPGNIGNEKGGNLEDGAIKK